MQRLLVVVAVTALWGAVASAQSSGLIRGVVKDAQGKPVESAKVTITTSDEVNRKFETKTGKGGDFLQIGLPSGAYTVTVEKDKLSETKTTRVSNGDPSELNFVLTPPAAVASAPVGNAEFQKAFTDGVAAARAGKTDEAIDHFQHALELNPSCTNCSANVATMYYSRGVDSWSAGKVPDAKKQFEAALKANPNHAESHFQLGMILVNENNIPAAVDEFNTYLKLSPEGPNAGQAKAAVSSLSKQ